MNTRHPPQFAPCAPSLFRVLDMNQGQRELPEVPPRKGRSPSLPETPPSVAVPPRREPNGKSWWGQRPGQTWGLGQAGGGRVPPPPTPFLPDSLLPRVLCLSEPLSSFSKLEL